MNLVEEVEALRQRAERIETACGDGALVWHRWGPANAAPVLLLRGGSGSWTHWLRNIAALADAGRSVLVPDLPGFGDSAPPPDGHDADVLPGRLELGLQRLIGDQPVDLVGFSFGGLVAGLWAQARPARVARLVLVGSPGLSGALLPPLDLRRWDALPAGDGCAVVLQSRSAAVPKSRNAEMPKSRNAAVPKSRQKDTCENVCNIGFVVVQYPGLRPEVPSLFGTRDPAS